MNKDLKPIVVKHCTHRIQKHQVVIYNSVSDELFMISKEIFFIYQLCNGIYTVDDIEVLIVKSFNRKEQEVSIFLIEILKKFYKRGIIEYVS